MPVPLPLEPYARGFGLWCPRFAAWVVLGVCTYSCGRFARLRGIIVVQPFRMVRSWWRWRWRCVSLAFVAVVDRPGSLDRPSSPSIGILSTSMAALSLAFPFVSSIRRLLVVYLPPDFVFLTHCLPVAYGHSSALSARPPVIWHPFWRRGPRLLSRGFDLVRGCFVSMPTRLLTFFLLPLERRARG
jgi:hypothetical protein